MEKENFVGITKNPFANVKQILKDPTFSNGFKLFYGFSAGEKGYNGYAHFSDEFKEDKWVLHQLNSKYPVSEKDKAIEGNKISFKNKGKMVSRQVSEDGTVTLGWGIYTFDEYDTVRTEPSQPWVHMMTEQIFDNPVYIKDCSNIIFTLDAKLDYFKNHMSEKEYNPNVQACQTNMYLIVRNVNESSPVYNSFIWFGVNIYDNRMPFHSGSKIFDGGFPGATDTLIYIPKGEEVFGTETMHDYKWHSINIDIKSQIVNSLETANQMNLLKGTSINDLAVTSFFISSEISGTFDVELKFKNLGFFIIER